MGMKKAGAVAEQPDIKQDTEELRAAMAQPESGATAAIERLSKAKPKAAIPTYKARDYDAEALGKTRCVQFEAALMSPAIAGMKFDTMEEYLKLVRQAAEAGVAFSFEKQS